MGLEHIHFVTGRLAEATLRSTVAKIAASLGFDYSIDVLPITVAALMTPRWVARKANIPERATRVVLPGYCQGDLDEVAALTGARVERGPRDLRQLPQFFGQRDSTLDDYGPYDIEIIAEINHAPRLSLEMILQQADRLRADGANLIDVGCEPGDPWAGVGECVRALRAEGYRVSIDSLQPAEIEPAVLAGAELVLSVNSSNREAAKNWGCEVVVIPDEFSTLQGLKETADELTSAGIRFRLDPVLEPIGCGFAASLKRYIDVRHQYPQAEMMMGIGNLTELTDVDSAGINVILLGICQELGIRSVLTTQVISWARTSVRECDLGRRLVHFAIQQGRPPKHVEPQLVMLRDTKTLEFSESDLRQIAEQIKDHNYRIFVAGGKLHLVSAKLHLADSDPFELLKQLMATDPKNLDASHAFYLGYELSKAVTAQTLGKQYEQDHALDWGMLTQEEPIRHKER